MKIHVSDTRNYEAVQLAFSFERTVKLTVYFYSSNIKRIFERII